MWEKADNFLRDIEEGNFRKPEWTAEHGYVDFLVQCAEFKPSETNRRDIPSGLLSPYVAQAAGVSLPNGDILYLCRDKIDSVKRLLKDESFKAIFLTDSWEGLFYSEYPYWEHVFDAEGYVGDRRDPKKIVWWRKRLKDVEPGEKIERIFPPILFSGDEQPNLHPSSSRVERLLLDRRMKPPEELIEAVDVIEDEIFTKLYNKPEGIYEITPRQFEELVCGILKSFGWYVELTKSTRDGGYDIFAISKDISGLSSSWIIECKRYSPDRKVGIDCVRSILGVKNNDVRAAGAMVATTSSFSRDVKDYKASRYDLELVDYSRIVGWLGDVYERDLKSGILLPR